MTSYLEIRHREIKNRQECGLGHIIFCTRVSTPVSHPFPGSGQEICQGKLQVGGIKGTKTCLQTPDPMLFAHTGHLHATRQSRKITLSKTGDPKHSCPFRAIIKYVI